MNDAERKKAGNVVTCLSYSPFHRRLKPTRTQAAERPRNADQDEDQANEVKREDRFVPLGRRSLALGPTVTHRDEGNSDKHQAQVLYRVETQDRILHDARR